MNRVELKVDIIRKFGTQAAFAKEIGWNENKLSKMMQGKYTPDLDEVICITEKLGLEENRFLTIFLDKKSPNGNKEKKSSIRRWQDGCI